MRQESLASQACTEELGREPGQEQILDRMEQAAPCAEPLASVEPCDPKPGRGRRLARLGIKLFSCFFHRWFNLYELGLEEYLYVSPMLCRFAGMNLGRAAVPQQAAAIRSLDLPEQDNPFRPDYSTALPREPKSGVPWKSPWLYLSLALLAWLFAL
jgi:hypothetical protein